MRPSPGERGEFGAGLQGQSRVSSRAHCSPRPRPRNGGSGGKGARQAGEHQRQGSPVLAPGCKRGAGPLSHPPHSHHPPRSLPTRALPLHPRNIPGKCEAELQGRRGVRKPRGTPGLTRLPIPPAQIPAPDEGRWWGPGLGRGLESRGSLARLVGESHPEVDYPRSHGSYLEESLRPQSPDASQNPGPVV